MMHPSRRLVQVLVLLYGLLFVPSSALAIALPVPTGVLKPRAGRVVPGIGIIDDSVFHALPPIILPTTAQAQPFSVQGEGDEGDNDDSQQQPEATPDPPPPPPPPSPTPTPTTQQTPTPTPSATGRVSVQASDSANQDDGSIPTASVVTVTISPGGPPPSTTSSTAGTVPTDANNSSAQQSSEVPPPAGLAPAMIALITVVVSLAIIVCAGVVYVKYWRRRRRQSEKEFYDPESGGPSTTGSQYSMSQSHISTLPSVTARMTPVSAVGSVHRPSYPLPADPFSVPTAYNRNDVLIMPPMPSTGSARSQPSSHSANSSLSSYPSQPSHSASSSLSQQAPPPGLTGTSSTSAALQTSPAPSPRNPFADAPPSPNPEIRIQPPSLPSSEGSVFSDYDELGSDMFFVPPPANPPSQQPGHAY